MKVETKLESLGFTLPEPPQRGGVYTPVREFGNGLLYASGFGPAIKGVTPVLGKLGQSVTLEQGQEVARCCTLNLLSALKAVAGDLDRVKRIVKLLVFVASDNDFYQQPQVANGATKLLQDVFGDEIGLPTRSAVGMNVLPGNIAVEIEALVSYK